ncbi:nitroreductase family protein [Papillibacter cinnamivorans]|uniref:Nitroreductase n=1 Tax=Papillibacter cinnamivorans DSM 12816 TaxID=1122930 RepID=A0A1W1YJI1_9FIRM|nr:nitroreductase family protein [Papillibacter cinnamivorans]SMC36286.1 Nitroreductase [Papillibacter cinnamivorans DSM 12816]
MPGIFSFPLEETIRRRRSVRKYSIRPVPRELTDDISRYIRTLSGPFPEEVRFHMLEMPALASGRTLGTYGMVSGASRFLAASVRSGKTCLEELGYEFETLVLYLTSLGIGTCWLATFDTADFRKDMDVGEDEIFPAVCPYGYAGEKAASVGRKSWEELYFGGDFITPLTRAAAGEYALPLELARLAPSSCNLQPWRVLKTGVGIFHFYEYSTPGFSDKFPYDVQRIDMGIAACHFGLSAKENRLAGGFRVLEAPDIPTPENWIYRFSWVCG